MAWDGVERRFRPPQVVVDTEKQKAAPVPAVIYSDARYKVGKRVAVMGAFLILLTMNALQYDDYRELKQKVDRISVYIDKQEREGVIR